MAPRSKTNLPAQWLEPDFLLIEIVSMFVNKLGTPMGITLTAHGTVMTGVLVSEREYLDMMNHAFRMLLREALENPTKEQLKSLEEALTFDQLVEDDYSDDDETADSLSVSAGGIRHLHLRDPMIIFPGTTLSFDDSILPVMRIRLTSIDGWLLGRVSLLDADDEMDGELPQFGRIH